MQAYRKGRGHRKDYRIAIVDSLSMARLENPRSWIDGVKLGFGFALRQTSGREWQRHFAGQGATEWRGARGNTLFRRHKKGPKVR